MRKIREAKEVDFLAPVIDVRTRWNSTYAMLVRAVAYKDIISDSFYSKKDNALIALLFDEEDWVTI